MDAFGPYRLLDRIAEGGTAEVYLARREGEALAQPPLVIKRLRPHLAQQRAWVRCFLESARAAQALVHPNIVRILEAGEHEGVPFIALEYVAGGDLERLRRRARQKGLPVPVAAACAIARDVARGLDYAHRFASGSGPSPRLVHRDVSPANILVGEDGRARITDFGIARIGGRDAGGAHAGSAGYMSPEQLLGAALDARSDQFALAVVLWELLTGVPLFGRRTEAATLEANARAEVRRPSAAAPRVPPSLDGPVLRALSLDPARRYPSLAQFAEALERAAPDAGSPAVVAQWVRAVGKPVQEGAGAGARGAPAAGEGRVEVLCDPPAMLWREGQPLGPTPFAGPLPHGRHRLRLVNAEQGLDRDFVVSVRAGRTSRLCFRLGRGEVHLVVWPGAEVSLQGKVLGSTPLPKLSLLEGEYLFTLKNRELGVERIVPIRVRPGRLERRTIDLTAS